MEEKGFDPAVAHHLEFFAGFSHQIGLIGIDEFHERYRIARWIDSDSLPDPRGAKTEERTAEQVAEETLKSNPVGNPLHSRHRPDVLELVVLKTWVFTISDPDPYPSIPHGHYDDPNRRWPKLNPYTGRVFTSMHNEASSLRLDKQEMRTLWRDVKFRNHCRVHLMWYMQMNPHYRFPVAHPLRLPSW